MSLRKYAFTYGSMIFLCAGAATAANLKIPAVAGTITVDGKLDEALWRDARAVPLNSPDFAPRSRVGGEARVAVCGAHLCLAARLSGNRACIVAMSQRRSPAWWREDLPPSGLFCQFQ